eukprot:TRINITY_DN4096_c0_g1_i1.p1 TRINITY_DN4096_c0_g1~~TRINITY_DN4096_c0_g1_i1.p1  ORF type:complete len:775 (-),score=59.97 TRINITY_DN4096_c0_g1_i1:620-2944(-)
MELNSKVTGDEAENTAESKLGEVQTEEPTNSTSAFEADTLHLLQLLDEAKEAMKLHDHSNETTTSGDTEKLRKERAEITSRKEKKKLDDWRASKHETQKNMVRSKLKLLREEPAVWSAFRRDLREQTRHRIGYYAEGFRDFVEHNRGNVENFQPAVKRKRRLQHHQQHHERQISAIDKKEKEERRHIMTLARQIADADERFQEWTIDMGDPQVVANYWLSATLVTKFYVIGRKVLLLGRIQRIQQRKRELAVRVLQTRLLPFVRVKRKLRVIHSLNILGRNWLWIYINLKVKVKRRMVYIIRDVLSKIGNTSSSVGKLKLFFKRVQIVQRVIRRFVWRRRFQLDIMTLQWAHWERKVVEELSAAELTKLRHEVSDMYRKLRHSGKIQELHSSKALKQQRKRILDAIDLTATGATGTGSNFFSRSMSVKDNLGSPTAASPVTILSSPAKRGRPLKGVIVLEGAKSRIEVLAMMEAHRLPNEEFRPLAETVKAIRKLDLRIETVSPTIRRELLLEQLRLNLKQYKVQTHEWEDRVHQILREHHFLELKEHIIKSVQDSQPLSLPSTPYSRKMKGLSARKDSHTFSTSPTKRYSHFRRLVDRVQDERTREDSITSESLTVTSPGAVPPSPVSPKGLGSTKNFVERFHARETASIPVVQLEAQGIDLPARPHWSLLLPVDVLCQLIQRGLELTDANRKKALDAKIGQFSKEKQEPPPAGEPVKEKEKGQKQVSLAETLEMATPSSSPNSGQKEQSRYHLFSFVRHTNIINTEPNAALD